MNVVYFTILDIFVFVFVACVSYASQFKGSLLCYWYTHGLHHGMPFYDSLNIFFFIYYHYKVYLHFLYK